MKNKMLLMFLSVILSTQMGFATSNLLDKYNKVSKNLKNCKAVSFEQKKDLFDEFRKELKNIDLKIKIVPLLFKIDLNKFKKISRKCILDRMQPFKLKDAFWRELINQLTLKPKKNIALDQFISKLLVDAKKYGWSTNAEFDMINYYQRIFVNFNKYLKSNRSQQVTTEEFEIYRKNLLLGEKDKWQKNFIEAHSAVVFDESVGSICSTDASSSMSYSIDQKHMLWLVELLSQEKSEVRMAAVLELRSASKQNFGFNPISSENERSIAVEKWKQYFKTHDIKKELFKRKGRPRRRKN